MLIFPGICLEEWEAKQMLRRSPFSLPSLSFAHVKEIGFMIQLAVLNIALKPIWVSLEIFLCVSSYETPTPDVLFSHCSLYNWTKHILGAHCEAGIVLRFKGTKETKCSPGSQEEHGKVRYANRHVQESTQQLCWRPLPLSWAPPPGGRDGFTRGWVLSKVSFLFSFVCFIPPPYPIPLSSPTGSH